MKCPRCGHWNQPSFPRCFKCGAPLEEKNESAPSLYMMRDSYAVSLVPFLKESFSESSFDWTYDFSCDEILDSGADVVVFEVVEKALDNLAKGRALS